jgi:hypothetical protein
MKMARNPTSILHLMKKGFFFIALRESISASRMKPASRRWIDGTGNIAFEYYLTSSLPWIERGNRG